MIRFLSNYLFQNENAPEGTEDNPSTTPIKPNETCGGTKGKDHEEFMDFSENHEGDDELRREEEEDEDDWVLIDDGKRRDEQSPVLVVPPPPPQPAGIIAQEDDEGEDDEQPPPLEADSEEEEEEDDDEGKEPSLLWENKLIEHPSMSVYIDLATSVDNDVTNSMNLSSIAHLSSPGESVIVLEDHEDDEEEEEDDMDIVEMVTKVEVMPIPILRKSYAQAVSNGFSNHSTVVAPPAPAPIKQVVVEEVEVEMTPLPPPPPQRVQSNFAMPQSSSAPLQNMRRKKGHFPSSTTSSNLPRRHLRSSAGAAATIRNSQTFQAMIGGNSPSWSSANSSDDTATNNVTSPNTTSGKKKRGGNNASSSEACGTTACGLGMVGGPAASLGHHSSSMLNKNLKLMDMFPTAAAKSAGRRGDALKSFATPRGHYLQESRKRKDLHNYTRHSQVNNDRRSAQQRRVQRASGAQDARK